MTKRAAVAISGASGMPYARRLLEILAKLEVELYVVASDASLPIYESEMGESFGRFSAEFSEKYSKVKFYSESDFSAPIASGSFNFDAMAVCPCSMKTLGLIANGCGSNLICRAADVALKERRRLVLVARETPLALTHLRNMCAATEAGAVILPACPAFYGKSESVFDLVNFVAARTVAAMGFEHNEIAPWGE